MRCAFVIILMVLFWTTECLPLAVTGLVPMILYPMLSLVSASELAPKYMAESNIAFVGSIMVINAFEKVGLHKRFALSVLMVVGSQPRWLLAGFMVVSWFLSMWCSNTMTTVLLIPIVISVTSELRCALDKAIQDQLRKEKRQKAEQIESGSGLEMTKIQSTDEDNEDKEDEEEEHEPIEVPQSLIDSYGHHRYENMLLLAIAYSASIGGTGTVIGTGPNLIMKEQLEKAYTEKGCLSPLNFLSWMMYAIPMSFIMLIVLWVWMLIYWFGPMYTFGFKRSPLQKHSARISLVVKNIYNELPPFDAEQIIVAIHCLVMIVLLVTRQLSSDPPIGWELMALGYVKESTATIIVALSLFIFPVKWSRRDPNTGKMLPPESAINWANEEKNFPFGLILLIGGGMAAAFGAEESGLASVLASLLNQLVQNLDDVVALLVMIVFMIFVTEFMSNTACVTLMMPIYKELAEIRGVNPMLFMFPTALSASFAFMFPVATPPNALIFQTGKFRIIDMIRAGFMVNILGIGVSMLAATTFGNAMFGLTTVPWELDFQNSTHATYNCVSTSI